MTANTSIISIANRSLLMIGSRSQISNLQDGTPEANAISALYQPTYEQISRTAAWNCLRQQKSLTLLAAAAGTPENLDGTTMPIPPSPWLYSYAVPSDSLQIRFILPPLSNPSTGQIPISPSMIGGAMWVTGAGQIKYAVAYGVDAMDNPREIVLCNVSGAQAVYTVNQPNPVVFDSLFEQGLVAALGAYLVPALSLDLALMDRAVRQAEMAIAQARTRDGNEGVVTMNRNADWMTARQSGGGLGWSGDYGNGLYDSMVWPGG